MELKHTATALLIAALAPAPAAAQSCNDLRALHALLEETTSEMVQSSLAIAADIAVGGTTGQYDAATLTALSQSVTDPLLTDTEAAMARIHEATTLVRRACP